MMTKEELYDYISDLASDLGYVQDKIAFDNIVYDIMEGEDGLRMIKHFVMDKLNEYNVDTLPDEPDNYEDYMIERMTENE